MCLFQITAVFLDIHDGFIWSREQTNWWLLLAILSIIAFGKRSLGKRERWWYGIRGRIFLNKIRVVIMKIGQRVFILVVFLFVWFNNLAWIMPRNSKWRVSGCCFATILDQKSWRGFQIKWNLWSLLLSFKKVLLNYYAKGVGWEVFCRWRWVGCMLEQINIAVDSINIWEKDVYFDFSWDIMEYWGLVCRVCKLPPLEWYIGCTF